ncbi:MAG: energy-coupling factor ABC transporter ATP-binding protein [Oscillospiraceae bacterium]|jgi:cobalt/nickel transport system ATP-binding protein|nr:energy-coupling factor ABC transporter ATP-binding protein [Oscillospiraceae bacterium]
MRPNDEVLRIENIGYRYHGAERPALNGVSVTVRRGERVAVLGSNGAGKSTFFLCCNGVLRPQSGRILLNGNAVGKTKREVYALRQAIGLVFQDPDNQIIAGTVESEIAFGPMNLKLPGDEVDSRVDSAISRLNLEQYRTSAPHYLSGGEKKRVAIADILAMEPQVILFDEPTASLDPLNVAAFERTLEELSNSGIAIVISTHDVDFAYRATDRAVVFANGAITADTSVESVFGDAAVLAAAGLRKPLLFEAAEILGLAVRPRTIEQLRRASLGES